MKIETYIPGRTPTHRKKKQVSRIIIANFRSKSTFGAAALLLLTPIHDHDKQGKLVLSGFELSNLLTTTTSGF